ncbi:MAG: DMT family transporter [Pseudomonadota bacterium]|nr:DMT family transporter [Pseudomonadota bacterium]
MSYWRSIIPTTLALLAFAGNSILCRLALKQTAIDPASFTTIRLISGAAMLWLLIRARSRLRFEDGNWLSATALFAYAAAFSFAYVSLTAATGALILFGAVQITMIWHGIQTGERPRLGQASGIALAFAGLVGLLLPGLSAPPLHGALLMIGAGLAWGIYSLRGRGVSDPIGVNTGNFLRTVPMALVLSACTLPGHRLDHAGVGYAIASGALCSGIGYAIWYTALPMLKASTAATVQLSVPVIAAFAGIVFLNEPISWRLALASAAVLGGIALVLLQRRSITVTAENTDNRGQ